MRRRAFTLAELVVVLAVGGTAAALMIGTLVRQQRFHSSAAGMLEVRAQLRDGAGALAADLRGAAVAMLGLPLMTDTAVELYTVIASSIACTAVSSQSVGLPPLDLVSGNTLTSMLAYPDTGDVALVYGTPAGAPDSARWELLSLSAFASRSLFTSCPPSTGFTDAGDVSPGFVATFEAEPGIPVRAGSPVQFLRRGRYSLYRSSDGKWYLGYRRCAALGAPVCGAIQPLSGPYDPYSAATAQSGLVFRYFDDGGVPLPPGSPSTRVARIDIVVRGRAASALSFYGDTRSSYRDSVVVVVSPRNRWR